MPSPAAPANFSEENYRYDKPDPLLGTDAGKEQAVVHQTLDLEAMIEIERQTVEK